MLESGLNVCEGFGVNHGNHLGIINPVAALLTNLKGFDIPWRAAVFALEV